MKIELFELLRHYKLGVVASVATTGAPQAAIVGIAVTEQLEIVFDALTSSRKFANIAHEKRVAVVVGEGELTIQIEGEADVPANAELERVREVYFAAYPDGRERMAWPDITWLRIRPTWIRIADYNENPPVIAEHRL